MTAMDMGFSASELKSMNWARLVFFMNVKANAAQRRRDSGDAPEKDVVRDATQADIAMLY